jgi:hypothetical protein
MPSLQPLGPIHSIRSGRTTPKEHSDLLRRRHGVESLSDFRLPCQLGLAEDFSRWLELLAAIEQDGAQYDGVWAHDLLVMVDVTGAIGAVVAVDCFSCEESVLLLTHIFA